MLWIMARAGDAIARARSFAVAAHSEFEVAPHRAAGGLVICLVAMMTVEAHARSSDEPAKIVERDVRPILEDAGGIAVALRENGRTLSGISFGSQPTIRKSAIRPVST